MNWAQRAVSRILLVVVLCLVPLAASELFLRARFGESPYAPGEQLRKVQSYLRLHPTIGFRWKANIDTGDGVRLPWADQIVEPLSTDEVGFRNLPQAIAARNERTIDIIGLGDSFVHDAAYVFHEFFWDRGLFYYNMAMHRQCPPQYNLILD